MRAPKWEMYEGILRFSCLLPPFPFFLTNTNISLVKSQKTFSVLETAIFIHVCVVFRWEAHLFSKDNGTRINKKSLLLQLKYKLEGVKVISFPINEYTFSAKNINVLCLLPDEEQAEVGKLKEQQWHSMFSSPLRI